MNLIYNMWAETKILKLLQLPGANESIYHQASNISCNLRAIEGNKFVNQSDVVGACACRHCIFITPGFNGLGEGNCKTRRETFKFWDLVHLILQVLQQTALRHPPHWLSCCTLHVAKNGWCKVLLECIYYCADYMKRSMNKKLLWMKGHVFSLFLLDNSCKRQTEILSQNESDGLEVCHVC